MTDLRFRQLCAVTGELVRELEMLTFRLPVTHVYNPLVYAREPYERYLRRYGNRKKEVVLLGMNPGPWGMAQTGVPFGEVSLVRDWLGISGVVESPVKPHPRRPVEGFDCRRSEVSGRRLWGWARERFQVPQRFFDRFFVANYCPLMFMDENGRNRTPDKLKAVEKRPLQDACDRALRRTVRILGADTVVGIGRFAADRAAAALVGLPVETAVITHPSPANPKANRGWAERVEAELSALGVL